MACHGCEQRRVVMRLLAEASREWGRNPTGPSLQKIWQRLREEAITCGELDGTPEN